MLLAPGAKNLLTACVCLSQRALKIQLFLCAKSSLAEMTGWRGCRPKQLQTEETNPGCQDCKTSALLTNIACMAFMGVIFYTGTYR